MDYPHPCDVNAASSLLFDMVVLAGGEASHMSPLCDIKPKPLLPLCNRPLIWFTLKPWVDSGVSHFHVVTHEDQVAHMQKYLTDTNLTEFPNNVTFEFITVSQNLEEDDTVPTDSADGLRAFAVWRKAAARKNPASASKDVLVISCDTILANVDMQPFIHNFYRTFSSASTLLVAAPPKDQQKAAFYSTEDAVLIAVDAQPDVVSSQNQVTPGAAKTGISHERLHMHYTDEESSLDLSAGFVCRRPNLRFSKTAMDVHVYLLKGWILDFLEHNREIRSIRSELLALLSTSQYWKVNGEEAMDPGRNIKFKIPPHWMVSGSRHYQGHAAHALLAGTSGAHAGSSSSGGMSKQPSAIAGQGSGAQNAPSAAGGGASSHHHSHQKHRGVSMLNSMQDNLPRPWDDLRVYATTYTHDSQHRIVRINSKERYKAVSEEIVSGLLGPISAVTSPLQAMVIRQLERENQVILNGQTIKARGVALASLPPAGVKMGRSVVGRGVKIGDGANIQRSVIMDNAEIGAGTIIHDCVICSNIQIGPKEVLKARPVPQGTNGVAVEVIAQSILEEEEEGNNGNHSTKEQGGSDDEFAW